MKTLFFLLYFSASFLNQEKHFTLNVPPTEKKILLGSAENCVVYVNWKEEASDSVVYYELEYSDEGTMFIKLGKYTAKSPKNFYYHGQALGVHKKENMFRLKIYFLNGDYCYSNIVTLSASCQGNM